MGWELGKVNHTICEYNIRHCEESSRNIDLGSGVNLSIPRALDSDCDHCYENGTVKEVSLRSNFESIDLTT